MRKIRASLTEPLHSSAIAGDGLPSFAQTEDSINRRIDADTSRLIDDAAAVLSKTRTEFMIDTARSLAIDVLLDRRLFMLDSDRYDAFIHALDNPPSPGPKLRALLRRVSAWET